MGGQPWDTSMAAGSLETAGGNAGKNSKGNAEITPLEVCTSSTTGFTCCMFRAAWQQEPLFGTCNLRFRCTC